MRIAPTPPDWLDESVSLESGYFARPVPSPLPDLERQATWEWSLRPEIHCLEQWLDFNA